MQDRPGADALIQAVARFLGEDLLPKVEDRGLAFRVRIAAHLLGQVGRELELDPAQTTAQRERLQGLLGCEETELIALRRALVEQLKGGDVPEGTFQALKAGLEERLAVVNPEFDRRPDIEDVDVDH